MSNFYSENLQGEKLALHRMDSRKIPSQYLLFLRDPEVTKFLQARFINHDESTVRQFIEGFDHRDKFLFGIWLRSNSEFIGTITLRVDPNHRFSNMGYLIGNPNYWNGEISMEACKLIIDFAVFERGVRKILECTTDNHLASNFNFRRLGFTLAAKIPDLYWGSGKYHAGVYWTLDAQTWARRRNRAAPDIPIPLVP